MAEQEFLNYASGDEENVSVPRKFRAGRNTSDVELAYITPEEAGILATLRPGSPHRGPMEVPSYDDIDASGRYSGSEALDYGGGSKAFGSSSVTGQGLAAAGQHPDPKMNEIAAFNKSQWNQRFKPYNQRTGQGGQGFFGSLFGGGIRNFLSGLGDKLRTVDGQVMPQSYFSEEEREKRRALRGIETIMNRKNPVTNRTNKRLGQLYDTAYGVGQGDRNFFGGADIGKSPAMLQANELGLYDNRINKPTTADNTGSRVISEAEYNAQPEFNFNTGPQIKRVGGLYGDHEIPDDIQNYLENQAAQNWMDSVQSGQGKSPHLSIEQIGEIADDATMGFYQGDQSSLKDYQRGLVQNVGMNQDQIDYLNKVNQMNKNVDNTGEGAFYTYETPQNVMKEIESLNPESDKFFGGIDPDKIVVGDKSTYAQPQEVYDYINKLQPSDSYRYGKGTIGIATGGRVGYKTGGRVGILAAF